MADTTHCSHNGALSVCSAFWQGMVHTAAQPADHTVIDCWRLFAARSRRPVMLFSGGREHCYCDKLAAAEDTLLFWFVIDGEVTLSPANAGAVRMASHSASLVRLNHCCAEVQISATASTVIALLEIPHRHLSELLTPDEYERFAAQLFAGRDGEFTCDVLTQQITTDMYAVVQSLAGEYFPPSLRDFFVTSRADELIARFLKNQLSPACGDNAVNLPVEFTDRIQQARRILLDNYFAPPTLEQLARQVGINRNKLCRGFRQLFGLTVFEYCHRHRMQLARTLLRENNVSIAHVAEATGYEHPGNFTAAYKRHYGELPKVARQHRRLQTNC
ncbi:helix-turn-helix transcriptional regulator [Exilibacterium tricleocarpae]|uniref:Helix-turn-helix transcriptional regulator n=1 Tax=Exilibacterium tricleocarpae TaxID=2591008 RepID=A0A545SXF3_9GAMM|nr:AraC family transcriptional regulator [Exilibacterium tricleocarpae]TQV69642.1 helix-turn-helix transcriptional regulator [Exilibacterium tricleocarpae]